MKLAEKPLKAAGWIVVIVALLVAWHYFLVSTRSPKLKAWESCKARLLENWARSRADHIEPMLHFTKDHFYSFGGESPIDRFDDHDSRAMAVIEAAKLGVSEQELIQIDQRIANECGPFPRQR